MSENNPYAPPKARLEDVNARPVNGRAEATLIGLVAPLCMLPLLFLIALGFEEVGLGTGPSFNTLLGQVVGLVFYQATLGVFTYGRLTRWWGARPMSFVLGGAVPMGALWSLTGRSEWAVAALLVGAALGGATWWILRWNGKRRAEQESAG